MTTFWDGLGLSRGYPRTGPLSEPRIAEERPYTALTSGANPPVVSPAVAADAATLFPVYDASTAARRISSTTSFRPAGWSLPPTDPSLPAKFVDWHSAWQIEYLMTNGTGSPRVLVLGGSENAFGATLTAIVSAVSSRVLIAESLHKQDILTLAQEDQTTLAATTAFLDPSTGIAARFGLSPTGEETAAQVRAELVARCEAYKEEFVLTGSRMTESELSLFKASVDVVSSGLRNRSIFEQAAVKTRLEDVKQRYRLAFAMASIPLEKTTDFTAGGVTYKRIENVITQDGGTALAKSYARVIDNERAMLDIDEKIANILDRTAGESTLKKSAVSAVASLQFLTNLRKSYEVKTLAEEVNLQKGLLDCYLAIQSVINTTSASAGTDVDKGVPAKSADATAAGYDGLDDKAKRAINMFDVLPAKAEPTLHPLEKINGWIRPQLEMIYRSGGQGAESGLVTNSKRVWDGFGTSISNMIDTISNDTQVKSNKLNQAESERNKHSELANKANARLVEIFQSIVDAGSE